MSILPNMYEKLSANNKVHLMKKLFNLKIEKGASMVVYVNKFNTIVLQLTSVETILTMKFVLLFFCCLYQILGSQNRQ